jgi:hypothetical protein
VRTAFQRWHVPKGYRVVWSDRPPESRPEVALYPEENAAPPEAPAEISPAADAGDPVIAAGESSVPAELPGEAPPPAATVEEQIPHPPVVAPAGSGTGRLPIQDVLARLSAEDESNRSRETTHPPLQAPAPQRRPTWDFMDEDPFGRELGPNLSPGGSRAFESGGFTSGGAQEQYGEVRSRRVGGLPERWRKLRAAMRNFWSGPAEPNPPLVIGLALAVAVAAAVGLALYSGGRSSPGPGAPFVSGRGGQGPGAGPAMDPFAAEAPDISRGEAELAAPPPTLTDSAAPSGERAYVAASLLVCREAPVLQARRVRNLLRGREVRVLGRDGDWASLAYRGGQCWARARYLSPVPPLEGR